MEPASAKASTVSLAAAVLVGAGVAAATAYWLHKRAVQELFEEGFEKKKYKHGKNHKQKHKYRLEQHRRKAIARAGVLENGELVNGNDKVHHEHWPLSNSPSMSDSDDKQETKSDALSVSSIPPGLPKLKTKREGSTQSLSHPGSTRRVTPLANSVIRPSTPKSPLSNTGAFESVEGSDDEDDMVNGEDQNFNDADEKLGPEAGNAVEGIAQLSEFPAGSVIPNGNLDQGQKGMNKSHSIPGDLHGVHAPDPVAADILRKEPEQETFVRLVVTPIEAPSDEEEEVCRMMQEVLAMRERYVFRDKLHPWDTDEIIDPCTPKPTPDPFVYKPESPSEHYYKMENGVMHVYENKEAKEELFPVADATTFFTDMHRILRIISLGNVRTLCHHRLRLLEQKFSLHLMLNADREFLAQKSAPHRDFYNVRKVDTHVHHSSCMNQKHLLRFIKSKLRKEPDEVVIFRDGKYLTLKEVFESLDLTGYDLNVDLLDVHADKNTFHRFDKFNLKYNPCGQSRLREIFLKQDNLIQGRFLAELTKEVFSDLSASKYQVGI